MPVTTKNEKPAKLASHLVDEAALGIRFLRLGSPVSRSRNSVELDSLGVFEAATQLARDGMPYLGLSQ